MRKGESVTLQFKRRDLQFSRSFAASDALAALEQWKASGAGIWRYLNQSQTTEGLVATLEFDAGSSENGMAELARWCEEFGIEPAPLH